jgi:hypothetical protein
MPSILDSGKIIESPSSIKQIAEKLGFQFPLSIRQFIDSSKRPFSSCNRIHIKILTNPSVPIHRMLSSMRQIYSKASICIIVVSREELKGPTFDALTDISIGNCVLGRTTTEQNQLFQNRNNVGNNEIVIYFVRSTVPAANGCASHPNGRPGAVIANIASRWTLAHEVGHVLGLLHISGEGNLCQNADFTRLMTGCSTSNIVGTPVIVQSEINAMRNSNLTVQC